MRDINHWMIKFGFFLILIGLIVTFSPILFYLFFSVYRDRSYSIAVYNILKFLLILGIIILSIGLIIYLKGIRNRYIKPQKQLLYPHPGLVLGNPLNPQQIRYCQRCNRQVPVDSKWCPYCANKMINYYVVTPKSDVINLK